MGALEQAADPDPRRYEIQREAARHFTQLKAAELVKYGLMPPEAAMCRLTAIDDEAIATAAGWYFKASPRVIKSAFAPFLPTRASQRSIKLNSQA
jgi:hypothetical protein